MIPYINIHTHRGGNGVNILDTGERYLELKKEIEKERPLETTCFYSVGWHPMKSMDREKETVWEELKQMLSVEEVVAVGECGLDRRSVMPFSEQIPVFIEQIKLAEQFQKPLIIHCVKAYPDLIQIHKNRKTGIPWIIHGFNTNEQILCQLVGHEFYISIGAALLNPDSNASRLLTKVPLYALFLESDDRETPIEVIYEATAGVLGIGIEALKTVIDENYKRVFKK